MRGGESGGVLAAARGRVLEGLGRVNEYLAERGMPACDWDGKLIRPLVGYAGAGEPDPGSDDDAVWFALAAVQLAHEASLLHDDVIDRAAERRGEPTVAEARGVAAALVEGDHLLTSAYRLAARTRCPDWIELFARAVERTVAGERAQAAAAGRRLDREEYEAIVLGKSGELLGAALAAGPFLRAEWSAHRGYDVGRRIGLVYQMLDDLLDYCPRATTGKPALADYGRGLWTWPREHLDLPEGLDRGVLEAGLRDPSPAIASGFQSALNAFLDEAVSVGAAAADLLPGDAVVPALLREWTQAARAAVAGLHGEDGSDGSADASALPPVDGWQGLMEEHAKSFRFASRLFPADRREEVGQVYAWCRYTDDLVDGVDAPPAELEARLDAWLTLSRRAYDGEVTGNPLADQVMAGMRAASVPFGYAEALIEGMRMDVRGTGYGTLSELWTYTYRVASVVGLWLTEQFGIRDPWMLDRAASLGHAMQLTNILRDVGEDLAAGRLYLPTTWLAAHDLTRSDLERMARTGDIDEAYRSLIERLLRVAESEYDHAFPAITRLPAFFRRPVAVASDVYRGIHDAIRANGYDNLTERAYTTLTDKVRLGAGALWRARAARGGRTPALARAAIFALAGALLPAGLGAQAESVRPAAAVEPVPTVEAVGPVARAVDGIGHLWVLAVDSEDAVHAGLDAVDRLRDGEGTPPELDPLLRVYRGSFLALRAKHGSWPPARLRDVREGFALMDGAVADAPTRADVRYIRLMSGFHLPGIFGRGDEVDADLAALARLLPDAASLFPAPAYRAAVEFVLTHGDPAPDHRSRLEAALR
jgi:phytoene synthase